MNDPDTFLRRWSRRKHEAGKERGLEQGLPEASAAATPDASTQDQAAGDKSVTSQAPQTGAAPEPEFDPASLPSLDSIGADTDISPFLKPGVPGDLKLAALRRAWSADPAIRDFKGLQENDWNFNDPNGIPGFGELSPDTDVKKMLGQLFDETPRQAETVNETPVPPAQLTPASHEMSALSQSAAYEITCEPARDSEIHDSNNVETTVHNNLLQREENIATQNSNLKSDNAHIKRRRSQGGALPQ